MAQHISKTLDKYQQTDKDIKRKRKLDISNYNLFATNNFFLHARKEVHINQILKMCAAEVSKLSGVLRCQYHINNGLDDTMK